MIRLTRRPGSLSPVAASVSRSGAAAALQDFDGATGPYRGTDVTAGLTVDAQVVRVAESFDSWPLGALSASTVYGAFTTLAGAAQSAVASPFGGNALQVTSAAFGAATHTAAITGRWRASFYVQWSAVPTATHYFAQVGTTSRMYLGVTTAGQVQVRNASFTAPASGQSLFRVTAGARARVEIDWNPNIGARVGLFYGPDLYLDTPSEVLVHTFADTATLGDVTPTVIQVGNNGTGDGVTQA
jgi:hypothetical protein